MLLAFEQSSGFMIDFVLYQLKFTLVLSNCVLMKDSFPLQLHENVNILCKARDNILAILNE